MSEQTEPIRRSVTVACSPERAFEVFTSEMGTWWPLGTHSRAASEHESEGVKVERVEVQGHVGGQVLEHMSNGIALPWADVLAWEPPARLVLAWKPNSADRPPTEVEVTFEAAGQGTLVRLEHRGWERLGAELREAARAGYDTGWEMVLAGYADAANLPAA